MILKKPLFNSMPFISNTSNENGFTLVELLIAMVVLMIIVFAFTPLFLGSVQRIIFAGDKTEALYEGQDEIEVKIVEKFTVDGELLIFTIGDTEVKVAGGLVEVIKEQGTAETWIAGFIPFVPSITIKEATSIAEEYLNTDVIILGLETQMSDGLGIIIYDSAMTPIANVGSNLTVIEDPDTYEPNLPAGYSQYAKFTLSSGLSNAGDPYIVETSWYIDEANEIEVTVRARLRISLPSAVAVGSGGALAASPDPALNWRLREGAITGDDINDVIWGFFNYIAVTSGGEVLVWKNQHEPIVKTVPGISDVSLNALAKGEDIHIAVGDKGTIILSSDDGDTWQLIDHDLSSADLYSVHWNEGLFTTVGGNGNLLQSPNGIEWSLVLTEESFWVDEYNYDITTFYGIASGGGKWVAVGEAREKDTSSQKAIVMVYDESSWEIVYEGDGNTRLNDVSFNGDYFVIVGDNKGKILFLEFDESGSVLLSENSFTAIFNSIEWDPNWSNAFIAVGNDGIVIKGVKGDWEVIDANSSVHFRGVAVR